MNAVRGPTAYAVGYFLAPLRGSGSRRVFRLMPMGRTPWATLCRPCGAPKKRRAYEGLSWRTIDPGQQL